MIATAAVKNGNCPTGVAPFFLDVEEGEAALALLADVAEADIK
jgi:hypothetical protein